MTVRMNSRRIKGSSGHFVLGGIHPEQLHCTATGFQKIQQTLDRCGLPRPIASKQPVTSSGLNGEIETVHGIGGIECTDQLFDLYDRCAHVMEWLNR